MLSAGAGPLHLHVDAGGRLRIGLGERADDPGGDWLGPGTVVGPGARTGVDHGDGDPALVAAGDGWRLVQDVQRLERPDGTTGHALVLALEATADLSATTGRGVASVGVGVSFDPAARAPGGWPAGLRAFGHQATEFGLPTQAGEHLDRWFLLPFRPAVVWPMWLCDPAGATILLAPLDTFHEQVLVVPHERPAPGTTAAAYAEAGGTSAADPATAVTTIDWGWHGDLDDIPAGTTSRLGVFVGDSPRRLLDAWVGCLDVAPRLPVDHDTLGRRVSYWTDNGAAYWYRTEPHPDGTPRSVTETLVDAVASVEEASVPIGAVQVDSWFYPHQTTRPFDTDDWIVPPSGLADWAPRADILPDGFEPLRAGLGHDRPLVAHCRHLWAGSPLAEAVEVWEDGDLAHPTGPDHYETLLDRAASWGVETFEHDWLVECWTGVRGLRAGVGRPRAWQEGIDAAAEARGMTLQWCMATPADLFQTATLRRVTSIRTSGDHGYLVGPGFLWAWFCYSSALARAFGLAPFKDVFASGGEHAEIEAMLSALSTGPVGLGDAIGTTDGDVVAATCRPDGTIVRPDVPLAAVDACYRDHAVARPVPLVAECRTDHAAGRWTQVVCVNAYRRGEPVQGVVDLGAATPTGDVVRFDLRTGALARGTADWTVALEPEAWTHHLLAPWMDLAGERVAVLGDVSKHAPVGRARIPTVERVGDAVRIAVASGGRPDEQVGVDLVVDGPAWPASLRLEVEPAGGPGPEESSPSPVGADGTADGSGGRDGSSRWRIVVPAGSTVVVSAR